MRGKLLLIVSAVAALHVSAANSFFNEDGTTDTTAGTEGNGRIESVQALAERLGQVRRYDASAVYSVLLPSAENAITYNINLQSEATSDSLAPCNYLISWEVTTPSGKSSGFTSYSAGNHFRYSDERLQEYHFDNDSVPFLSGRGGVQRNARFTDLLPAFLSREITRIMSDSAFTYRFNPDATYSGKDAVRLDAIESVKGYTARELSFIFDAFSGTPLHISIESNPGSVSEQSVTVSYSEPECSGVADFTEATLIGLYPEVFERFRQGNFRLENLPGTAMPQFSMPTPTGERYTYHRGDGFPRPVVIAVIDPEVASAPATVSAIRNAVNSMPSATDIIWAVKSRHIDTIESLLGYGLKEGETILAGANSIIRDCGITAFPAMIFVGRDGIIKSVHIGANKNLEEIVMQKVALL